MKFTRVLLSQSLKQTFISIFNKTILQSTMTLCLINETYFYNIQIQRMEGQIGDILHIQEIKKIIQQLQVIDIKQYASKKWFSQDEKLQQLNMQTHVNALMKTDQLILEECANFDKLKVMIADLVATDVWKDKVLPLLKPSLKQINSFKIYMCVYHEAVVCNLLEILMYYRTAVDVSGQFLIDVLEYSYHKLVKRVSADLHQNKFLSNTKSLSAEEAYKQKVSQTLQITQEQEFQRQIDDIQFSCCMMSISIVRYISDYLRFLQIGVIHYMVVECNIFGVLVPLIQSKPWLRVNAKGEREKYQNNKWTVVEKSQYGRLPKVQAQIWLTLYNLFMDPDCRKKYQLTEEKKNLLLRLRKYMNQVLLDQIPNLTIMLRSLEQLSLMNVPSQPSSNPFIVQVLPQIRYSLTNSGNKNWKQVAELQKEWLSNSNNDDLKEEVKRLADLYSHSTIQGLMEGFKCAGCKKQAFKRCSKCKKVWYCSKECQVSHWKGGHKAQCAEAKKQQPQSKEQVAAPSNSSLITQID